MPIVKYHSSHIKVYRRTGEAVLKAGIAVYPSETDKCYPVQYVYKPVIPETGIPEGLDGDELKAWLDSLPHIWELNPAFIHFIRIDPSLTKTQLEQEIQRIFTPDVLASTDAFLSTRGKDERADWSRYRKMMADRERLGNGLVLPSDADFQAILEAKHNDFKDIGGELDGQGNIKDVKPGTIDIGAAAIDRASYMGYYATWVLKDNPADGSGSITSTEIWVKAKTGACNIYVGTFSASGDTLTCRDSESIGDVAVGSKQTFSGQDIDVETGDYFGFYDKSIKADIESDNSGGAGCWYYIGDVIDPSDSQTFTPVSGAVGSLYGEGEEALEAAYIGQAYRVVTSAVSFTGQGLRIVKSAISYSGQVVRYLTSAISFAGQTLRQLTSAASYQAQTHRIITSAISFAGQTLRQLTSAASYQAQTHRIITSAISFAGQTYRVVTSIASYSAQTMRRIEILASYVGQTARYITSAAGYVSQTLRRLSAAISFAGQTKRTITSAIEYIAQTFRQVTSAAYYQAQTQRIVKSAAAYAAQTLRVVTTGISISYIAQTRRIVLSAASYTAQTQRLVFKAISFAGQTLRQVMSAAIFTGQTRRIVQSAISYAAQTIRRISGLASYAGQTARYLSSLVGYIAQTLRTVYYPSRSGFHPPRSKPSFGRDNIQSPRRGNLSSSRRF